MKKSKTSKGAKKIKLGIFLSSTFLFGFAIFVYYVVFGFDINMKTAMAGTEPPVIVITTPDLPGGTIVYSEFVDILGTVSDDVSVDLLNCANDRTGEKSYPNDGGNGYVDGWACNNRLEPGVNMIIIEATDNEENVAREFYGINYDIPGYPYVGISAPTSDYEFETNLKRVDISGGVNDSDGSIISVELENNRTGLSMFASDGGFPGFTNGWSYSDLELSQGLNTITVAAKDNDGNETGSVIKITYVDPDAPSVIINFPTDLDTYASTVSGISFSGIFSNDTAALYWENDRGGSGSVSVSATVVPGEFTWTSSVLPLELGVNVITFTARNTNNSYGSDVISVNYAPAPGSGSTASPAPGSPVVTIQTPVNADLYTSGFSAVSLSGTASDDVAIIDIAWTNDATGDTGIPTGIYAWSISDIALDPGVNNITITARDAAGNESNDTLEVIYTELSPDNASTRGFAWSSNAGWISFNYKDCDTDENGFVDSGMCDGDNVSTVSFAYGVDISNTATHYGDFSGYAWNTNHGWISFQENNPPDFDFSASCDNPLTCDGPEDNCTACFNSTTGEVQGWAKVLNLDDDGWIKLRKSPADTGGDYGLSITGNGEVNGFAWSGSDTVPGLGWISFNCGDYSSCLSGGNLSMPCTSDTDCGGDTCGDTCSLSSYAVTANINNPPTVRFIPMDNPGHCNYNCACGMLGPLNPQLLWKFSDLDPGDTQASYQIFFDKSDHNVAELDTMTDYLANEPHLKTPIFDGENQSFYPRTNVYRNINIDYNTTYYAWVKVWDNKGADSGWVSLDLDEVPLEFTTYLHGFPVVGDISWIPEKPSAGEPVMFDEDAGIYELSSPDELVQCDNDSSICAWEWTFPEDATVPSSTTSTPLVYFGQSGNPSIKLKVSNNDGSGYYCEKVFNDIVKINVRLPKWIETKD